jgi:hypothetical protein
MIKLRHLSELFNINFNNLLFRITISNNKDLLEKKGIKIIYLKSDDIYAAPVLLLMRWLITDNINFFSNLIFLGIK